MVSPANSLIAAVDRVALTKRYGGNAPAVNAIDLRSAKGNYLLLAGPSGGGKKATLRRVAGHESVSAGDILLENRNITDLLASERGTAMQVWHPSIFFNPSSAEDLIPQQEL